MTTHSHMSTRKLNLVALRILGVFSRIARTRAAFVLMLSASSSYTVSATAQELAGKPFEISVTWGSASHAVTTSYEVVPGETVEVSLGEEILSLVVLSAGDSAVDVQIGAARDVSSMTVAPVSEVRRGTLGIPIEVRGSESNAAFPSAVAVTVRKLIHN